MPCLKILTNLPREKIPKDFVNKILPVLSKAVKKPEDKFLCAVSADCQLSVFGDSASPGAVATLESIGNLGPEENKFIIREISRFVENELGIAPDKFFLTFYDHTKDNVAIFGTTVAEFE